MSQANPNAAAPVHGELTLESRFTGKAYVAVVRVLVNGKSVLVSKVDLAREGARAKFTARLAGLLPAADTAEVEFRLLRLCDGRANQLKHADQAKAEGSHEQNLADFERHLGNKDNTPEHVDLTVQRVRAVLEGIKAVHSAAGWSSTIGPWRTR